MNDVPAIPGDPTPLGATPGGGIGGGIPGLDLGSLMAAAQSMQAQIVETQQRIAETEVTGSAGGGAVEITVTGGLEFRSVRIDPATIDPDDPATLEDLVLAALRDAATRVGELQAQAAPQLPGFGDLGGLFG